MNTLFNAENDTSLDEIIDSFLKDGDSESEVEVLNLPYLEEFRQWLQETEGMDAKYAQTYLREVQKAYWSLYDYVGLKLEELLPYFITIIPTTYSCNLTKETASELIDIYIDEFQLQLAKNTHIVEAKWLKSFLKYKDFVEDKCAVTSRNKREKFTIPYIDEFMNWLETHHMSYENASKVRSSLCNSHNWLRPILEGEYDFFVEAAKLKDKAVRKRLLNFVIVEVNKTYPFYKNTALKTIKNCISNIRLYFNFLNDLSK